MNTDEDPGLSASEEANEKALAQFDALPDSAFVRMPTVRALQGGVPAQTIYRWIKEGHHPKPFKLGAQVSAWRVSDLRQHLASRKVAA
jgi:predicted DNA-binding transcriptional regulator AlpA